MLEIKNLKASINNRQILKGLNLSIKPGELHAVMGPNGSGKSTLANVLSGKNGYEISEELKNGVLDTDIDFLTYNLEGIKDLTSESLNHKLNLKIIYNSKERRSVKSKLNLLTTRFSLKFVRRLHFCLRLQNSGCQLTLRNSIKLFK